MSSATSIVLVNAVAWILLSVAIGFGAGHLPGRWLGEDTWWTRPRRWERHGRAYRRLGVHRWKRYLPEANGLGPRRPSKRRLPPRRELDAFVVETRRAEYVHVALALCGPLFGLWNTPRIAAAITVGGVVANAPFVVVQRYNRARVLGSRAMRSEPSP